MLTTPPSHPTNLAARVAIEPGFIWDAQDAYLFDIDGTLLRSRDRIHFNSFASSVHRVTGFEITLAGILLHDAGKTIEYEGTLATRRSRRGILQGHVILGYQLARKAALKAKLDHDRLERLEHIILSHQGELEWGAAVYAATPEAVFVSMVDNLDARMGMVERALRQANEGDEFSERLPGLNTQLLTKKV